MKLKIKLSQEYADREWPEQDDDKDTWDSVINSRVQVAFNAGFEKAREMAWEALGDTEYSVHPRIQKLLLNLGEEEV